MLSNLSIEDEEYLHDLIDEIIHVEGRWDTNERRILFKETNIPLFAHHVREYLHSVLVVWKIAMMVLGRLRKRIVLRRKRSLRSVLMRRLMR